MKQPSVAELELLTKACDFAERAHQSHARFSGEPYLTHLVETAKILAELGMRGETVAAGLLHDAIEDAGVSGQTLEQEFGGEIRMLVEGVTALGRLHYRGVDRYRESMRRFFVASSRDLRVIIVKLADRLHNMRTLRFVPKEKQLRIAQETLEIYAPIAHRLGIRKVSRELQDLSFPFVHPEEHARVEALMTEKKSGLTKRLEKFHRSLLKSLAEQSIAPRLSYHRLKGPYSMFIKLKSKDWDSEKIYDLLAVRVIVASVEDCYRALGAVHAHWRPLPGRIKDYIAFPKPNGYQSLHTNVFTGDGRIVEIQIRTEEMHRESEYGVAVHFEYKERQKETLAQSSYLAWAKKLLLALVSWRGSIPQDEAPAHTETESEMPPWIQTLGEIGHAYEEREFWMHLKNDIFRNRIFVFTPKGDVVDLPTDSSPIDFAYAIHSEIGDRLFGAKVNGKQVALETPLKNGDIVEIQTRASAHPTPKWLEFARTVLAKRHIRATLARLKLS
ncbi:MAG: HD domain-containing protein [Patescibacteria group bacterium]